MNNLFKTKKQAVIAAIALIIIIVLGTAGVIFALTSSAPKAADPVPEQSQQIDPDEQAEPPEPSEESTEAAKHSPAGDFITLDEAKQIALSDAGLTESQVIFYNVKLTQDDGRQLYKVEFYSRHTEYEYEINASSGKILECDIDYDDDYDNDDDEDDDDDYDDD